MRALTAEELREVAGGPVIKNGGGSVGIIDVPPAQSA
jgi:hypothetical protein